MLCEYCVCALKGPFTRNAQQIDINFLVCIYFVCHIIQYKLTFTSAVNFSDYHMLRVQSEEDLFLLPVPRCCHVVCVIETSAARE